MIGKSIAHYRILGELSMGGVAAFRLKRERDWRMIVRKGKVEIENTGLGRALSLKKSYDAVLAGSRRISKKGWTNE